MLFSWKPMSVKAYFAMVFLSCLAIDPVLAGQIATARGVGSVKIGMTVHEAERALGAKLDPVGPPFGEDCWITSRSDKKDPFIQYTVEDQNITAIDIYPPAAETFPIPIIDIKTPTGIGIGSTEKEIERLYGKSAKKELAPYFLGTEKHPEYRIHVDDPDGQHGIIFVVRYGRVQSFSVGLRDAINRMEGCI